MRRRLPCRVARTDIMRILLIEDDREVASHLVNGLGESGHRVEWAADGHRGLALAMAEEFDALIVDRMLPGQDGLAIVAALRAARVQTPVLILSALGDVEERVRGLRAGCDDYLSKPFAFSELLARLEALSRRGTAETRLAVGDLEMDLLSRNVTRAGQEIDLLPREFRLLEYLMRHHGHIVTRTMLLEKVWDHHFDPQTNVIDVHISRLRQKLDKGFPVPLLHTVRGAGYSLRAPG
jgi:two-component system, OmpR family, response regulator